MRKSTLAKNIKKLRLIKGMNQTEFAELFGINRSNIGSYEEARAEPKLDVLMKMASHFNLTIDQIVGGELTVSELAGAEPESDSSATGRNDLSVDERLAEITKRLAAIEKAVSSPGKKK